MRILVLIVALTALAGCQPAPPTALVKATADFEVAGNGTNPAWARTNWVALNRRQTDGHPYESRFKILYSSAGVYMLMEGTDSKITTTGQPDFGDLWEEDVYEAFLWPDQTQPLYLEYEISPNSSELPLLVPNNGGTFMGWRPWHYEGDRKIRKATSVRSEGWSAEFFIPYTLLTGIRNVPPAAGTRWRANFYRIDYDDRKVTQWDWARVGESFHEYAKFGVLIFE